MTPERAAASPLPAEPDAAHRCVDLAPATIAVTAGRPPREPDAPINVPIVMASTYHQGGTVGYGRFGNPTWDAFETALGALEGGTATAFASGMGAVSAVLDLLPDGSRLVAPRHAYSGSLALLRELDRRGRLSVVLVDVADTAAVVAASVGAAMVWVETPTNPALEVADLPAVVAGAQAAGALVVVDNTFATPILQRPLGLGADLVVHSATKYLGGHSDVLLGAVVTRDAGLTERVVGRRTALGATPGTVEAWLALRGLRTLALRVERSQTTAGQLSRRLQSHPAVRRVRYPGLAEDPGHARATAQMDGFGSIVCIEVGPDDEGDIGVAAASGAAAADRTVDACRLWVPATSLGGVESTLERRRRWPAESAGIPENLVRLSVGLEDVEDLWRDLDEALRSLG